MDKKPKALWVDSSDLQCLYFLLPKRPTIASQPAARSQQQECPQEFGSPYQGHALVTK
jgi:hypothetical protein